MSVLLKVKTQGNTQTIEVAKNVANQAVKIQHVGGNAVYELLDQDTGVAPQQIVTKRVGDDLYITFENSQDEDLIITDYYNDPALIQGLAENGQYYAYVPANGESANAIAVLNDSMLASEVLGGDPIVAGWLPHWGWIAAGVAAIAGIAIGAGSGGSGGSNGSSGSDTSDSTAPVITADDTATVTEKAAITPIKVSVTDNVDKTPTVTVDGLPTGLSYDPATGEITGTPTVTDWTDGQTEKVIKATVTAKDDAGNTETKEIEIKVQRDTDGDKIPDASDDDKDGDGIKNDDDKNPLVADTEDPVITANGATVTEKSPIEPIAVTVVDNDDKTPTVTVEGLPDGLTYANGQITGTPTAITDWKAGEQERTITATVKAKDDAGND
ncbi:Ig domain-containing protein, partial [Lonepinella sp. BR2271]|uniref:Ig domain-containing protein n=1 Tax=Lonepinella sp. BR2271 TaxID=3434550 RepID=UPI003F6DC920